jgi:phosphate transport system substrate-binding protein
VTKGVCRTKTCSQAVSGETVDLYPGPGEFCPECGEPLEPVEGDPFAAALAQPRVSAPGKSAASPQAAVPAKPPPQTMVTPPPGKPSAGAQAKAGTKLAPKAAPQKPPPPPPKEKGARIPAAALAFAGAALLFIMGALFLLRPSPTTKAAAGALHVCTTSVTQRLAADIATAYEAKTGADASAFVLVSADGNELPCDVRFMARPLKKADWTVAYDGVVPVVNPLNPVKAITRDQLRGIYDGSIKDWSQVGGTPGRIDLKLPDEASDESQLLSTTVLSGLKSGAGVQRLATSSDVVRDISSASGRNGLGLVAFSQASPAKILALGDSPIPSTLSIADHSYPLALTVMATSDDEAPDPKAEGLIKYARSADVQSLVVHSGLVAKEGF